MADKTKKFRKDKKNRDAGRDKKARKKDIALARKAKKGDGEFPDKLVVTRGESDDARSTWFDGRDAEDLSGLSRDGQAVAVYKLVKVSTLEVKRKVVR